LALNQSVRMTPECSWKRAQMSRVTIIGAGFGALSAVRALRRADRALTIDLVAPEPKFVFYPGTIWIPTGVVRPEQMEISLEPFFRRMRVNWHPGCVSAIEEGGRISRVGDARIQNHGLVIACGASFLNAVPGMEHTFMPCGGVDEMARLGQRLRKLDRGTLVFGLGAHPAEPAAVRGGPLLELLFGIETWLRRAGRRDRFRMVLFAPSERPGGKLGEGVVRRLLKQMQKRGIEVHLNAPATRFEVDRVLTERDAFESDLTVFMPGLTGQEWLNQTPLPRSPGGLVRADATCRVETLERVYVVGDAGSFPGPDWAPKRAHNADLQAEAAASNLLAELAGNTPKRRPKMELMAVLDMHDRAMLISRTPTANRVLPTFFGFHWAKRMFAWNYVRRYR